MKAAIPAESYFASVPPVQQPHEIPSSDYFAAAPPPPAEHIQHALVYDGVVVIGQQFCSPVPLDLAFFRKSLHDGDYSATDASGKTFFKIESRVGFHRKRVLLDKFGNNLLFLQVKEITLHGTWFAYKGIEAKEENKFFTVKASSAFQLKTGLDVFLASNSELKQPDFRVEGKYMAREYTVYGKKNKVLACGKRERNVAHFLSNANTYQVHIEPGVDSAFIITLMLIVDELHVSQIKG